MVRVATLACALAVSALIACSPRSASVVADPDHSHPDDFRATSDRRFDDASHWAKIFDSPERAAWQRPEELLTAIKLQSGMRVADLGAGTGFFLPYLSRTVGDAGRVLAVEVEPELVAYMR
jgi:cyclopropane fatty-acyl-phospholipid synthase-like methyltransferase